MVITAKHHDGFCMFDTDVDDYNIHDGTPFHRDPVAELAAACKRQGLRFGCYYSQSQDWHHPGGAASGGHWDPKQDGDYDHYLRTVAMPQVREILTRYQPAILWWDTPKDMTRERAEPFLPLLRLRPGIIMNNRLGGGFHGDYSTPEQHIPATGLNYDWETCMTMNGTWGYKSYDDNWKSTTTLIRNLVDIAGKGGNYLLNVGPTAEGIIPGPSVERLRQIGAWLKVNGESIYGTTAGVFTRGLPWGCCTSRRLADKTILYLHVFDWPEDGVIHLRGLTNRVLAAVRLDGKTAAGAIQAEPGADDVALRLPGGPGNPHDTVIKLTVAGRIKIIMIPFHADAEGVFTLHARDALVHGRNLHYERNKRRGLDNLGFWVKPKDWAEWPIEVKKAGPYAVTALVATPGDAIGFVVQAGPARLDAVIRRTGAYNKFQLQDLGVVRFDAPRRAAVQVRCGKSWHPINLRSLILRPTAAAAGQR
jgi:alpha-L-fucosidase